MVINYEIDEWRRAWKQQVYSLKFETTRVLHTIARARQLQDGGYGESDSDLRQIHKEKFDALRRLPFHEALWQIADGAVKVNNLGEAGKAELRRVLEKEGITRPEEAENDDMTNKKGKVAMTIRIGTVQTAALQVMAESSGRTIEETINDIIKQAALEFVSQQHRNKDSFVRVVQQEP